MVELLKYNLDMGYIAHFEWHSTKGFYKPSSKNEAIAQASEQGVKYTGII